MKPQEWGQVPTFMGFASSLPFPDFRTLSAIASLALSPLAATTTNIPPDGVGMLDAYQ